MGYKEKPLGLRAEAGRRVRHISPSPTQPQGGRSAKERPLCFLNGTARLFHIAETAMPITPFLDGHRFDQETKRVLGVAFEIACIALRAEDADDFVKQSIATKIIELAKAGERNPDLLCEQALKDIRGSQA